MPDRGGRQYPDRKQNGRVRDRAVSGKKPGLLKRAVRWLIERFD